MTNVYVEGDGFWPWCSSCLSDQRSAGEDVVMMERSREAGISSPLKGRPAMDPSSGKGYDGSGKILRLSGGQGNINEHIAYSVQFGRRDGANDRQ